MDNTVRKPDIDLEKKIPFYFIKKNDEKYSYLERINWIREIRLINTQFTDLILPSIIDQQESSYICYIIDLLGELV